MRQMFQSATIKLTAWYLLIIMILSFTFSTTIYQLTLSELSSRFETFQSEIEHVPIFDIPKGFFGQLRLSQDQEAKSSLIVKLFYTNLSILVFGGMVSYFLARRTLRPIEEANELQTRFVSDASHELRTPLAVLKLELETSLRDPKLSKEEMKELLESNLEEVNKLTNLSHTLLQLSQFDQTGTSLELSVFSLNETVESIVHKYYKKTERINIESNKKLNIKANSSSVEELARILIDNALKYSPDKSQINIVLAKRGKYADMKISNSGIGINPDDLPHIFDRFYRADTSRTTDSKTHGYGLGLSLAKKIIELNHGELSVSSTPNQLTEFTASLPLDIKDNRLKKHNE